MTPSADGRRGPIARPPAPFVVGVGRSGTTLLRMMLDAHSSLAIPSETNFAPAVRAFERDGPDAAVERIVHNVLWDDYNMPADELERRVELRRAGDVGEVLRTFYELYAELRGKERWGDKSPYYVAVMTQIEEILPEARFVHVVRDGRDVALSTIPLWFGPSDVAGAAREWSERLASARLQAQQLSFYTEVRYEDLVRDPASVLQRICAFLELEWEPSMLEYHRDAVRRLSAELGDARLEGRLVSRDERLAIHRLLDRPPQRERIERWRAHMDAADLQTFESIAASALEEFGYELSILRR